MGTAFENMALYVGVFVVLPVLLIWVSWRCVRHYLQRFWKKEVSR